MRGRFCTTCVGVLAIIGISAMVGAVHSMVDPVSLTLNSSSSQASQTPTGNADETPAQTQGGGEGETTDLEIGVVTGSDSDEFTLEQLQEMHENFYLFLDARTLHQYEQGHIPRALWMPVDRVLGNGRLIFDIEDEAGDLNEPIIIYCGGGDCDASENLAIVLQQAGFTNLRIFELGYPAWVEAGLEIELGVPPEVEP